MRRSKCACFALILGVLESSCTFYTACPAGGSNSGNNGNQSGGAGSGGVAPPPLLDGEWVNVTSTLAHKPSECGNLSFGANKPDEDMIIMGVAQHGLWATTDGGDSWNPLGDSSDPDPIVNRVSWLSFDPSDTNTFWESGVYNSFGIYKTTNDGKNFLKAGVIQHNDYFSVDYTDKARKTLLASGHEQVHKLYLSTDAATTWTEIGDYIPTDAGVCPFPFVLDSQTFLLGCGSYSGGKPGIFRSTDAGMNWQRVSTAGGGSPPLVASDGTMYWASEDTNGMTMSTDQGLTWSDPFAAGVVSTPSGTAAPLELPDGRIAELSKDSVIVSADQGQTWKPASAELPFSPKGFFYSPQRKAFYVYYITCGVGTDAVPANGIMRFDFDYETQ